jgi:hypothetical protein
MYNKVIFLKVNSSKADNPIKLSIQISKVILYLKERNKIELDNFDIILSYCDNDFIKNKKRLLIKFKK